MSAAINQAICQAIVSRMNEQGRKGKRRDDLAIEMCAGAWAALEQFDKTASEHWGRVVVMLISPRGFSEIERLANGRD